MVLKKLKYIIKVFFSRILISNCLIKFTDKVSYNNQIFYINTIYLFHFLEQFPNQFPRGWVIGLPRRYFVLLPVLNASVRCVTQEEKKTVIAS